MCVHADTLTITCASFEFRRGLTNGSRGVVLSFSMIEDPDTGMAEKVIRIKFETSKGEMEKAVRQEEFTVGVCMYVCMYVFRS
jgi:hypothetical protein